MFSTGSYLKKKSAPAAGLFRVFTFDLLCRRLLEFLWKLVEYYIPMNQCALNITVNSNTKSWIICIFDVIFIP